MKAGRGISNVKPSISAHDRKLKLGVKNSV